MKRSEGVLGRLSGLLAVGVILLSGCAAGPTVAPRESASVPPPTKTLRIGTRQEPVTGIALFGKPGKANDSHAAMFHAGLTTYDAQGNLQPRLARKIPSIADGDWKVLPDNTMEVTWKLRPNAKWHDGTPLAAEDFVLGIQVARDPDLPLPHLGGIGLVRGATAPDAETLVIRWSEPFFGANQGGPFDFPAVPRHLMQDLYQQGDKQAFTNNPYWTTQFVGLGPYRLGEWVQGALTEGLAFDDYFLGRPRIDKVILRYFNDPNVIVASLLAGDIDVVGNGSLDADNLAPVVSSWGANGGTIIKSMSEVIWAQFQFRDPAAPWVEDSRVRQALMHFIDRQALADTFEPGGSAPADLFVAPDDPVYRATEQRGFGKYPYDPAKAAGLLATSWSRGPDGVLQNSAGQRFVIEVRVGADSESQGLALADQWKRGGLEVPVSLIANNAADRMKQRATSQGVFMNNQSVADDLVQKFTTAQIRTEQNNWSGANQSGYSNPMIDRLYADVVKELDPTRRQSLNADFLKFAADELIFLPVFYSSGNLTTSFRRGVRGPGPAPIQLVTTWNIHEWDMD